jgi:hypothetical protein
MEIRVGIQDMIIIFLFIIFGIYLVIFFLIFRLINLNIFKSWLSRDTAWWFIIIDHIYLIFNSKLSIFLIFKILLNSINSIKRLFFHIHFLDGCLWICIWLLFHILNSFIYIKLIFISIFIWIIFVLILIFSNQFFYDFLFISKRSCGIINDNIFLICICWII